MIKNVGWCLMLAATLAGCRYDLDVPQTPARGGVKGNVDTQSHVPLANNTVTLVSKEGARTPATTDASGAFVFSDLAPGDYYLDLSLPGFAPLVVPSISVRSGPPFDAGTLTPTWLQGTPSEGSVLGKVEVTGGGDASGGQVEFLLQPGNVLVGLAPVGSGGAFVQRVPPGSYTLRASHPLYVTVERTMVEVLAGEQRNLQAAPLVLDIDPATVTGTVLKERDGETPTPAEGVLVTLDPGGMTTTTDPTGRFSLGGLAASSRTIRFTATGVHDGVGSRTVSLAPGETTTLPTVTLSLDRGDIIGRVELADRQPARDITVAVTGKAYSTTVSADSAEPWKGSFRIAAVPVGTYEVSASKTRYSRAVAGSVTVAVFAPVNAGTLTLTLLQGDFVIDDADTTNTAGYTRTPQVSLVLTGFSAAARFRASEDAAFTGASYQPFTGTTQPFVLATRQGTHTIYAQYEDANGTASPVFSSSIILDSVAPTSPQLTINNGASFTRVAQPLAVTLEGTEQAVNGVDAVSGLAAARVSESNTTDSDGTLTAPRLPYQRDGLFTRSAAADGPQTLYAQLVDHAGNVSAVVSASIVIDTQAPAGSISIARGSLASVDGFTNTPLVQLTQTASTEPNGGFVLIKLANSQSALNTAVLQPLSTASSWFLDPSSDGTKTVYAVLQDAAGNTSAQLTATLIYDSTPPSPVTFSLVGAAVTNQGTISVTVAATDTNGIAATGLTVSEDAFFLGTGTVGPRTLPGTPVPFTLSAGDGVKQLYARFRDVAGNDQRATLRVTLDTQAPSGGFTLVGTLADGAPSSEDTSTGAVTLTINPGGAVEYALGNETLSACPSTGYTPVPTDGVVSATLTGTASPREVRLCLRDAASNVQGPLLRTIALDGAAPTGCVLQLTGRKVDGNPAPAGRTASTTVTVALSGCSEAPHEVALTTQVVACNAVTAWSRTTFPTSFVLPGPDGTNTVRACVRDRARNSAAATVGTIDLDTTAPTAPTLTLDTGATFVNAAAVASRGGFIASAAGAVQGASTWSLWDSSVAGPVTFTAFPGTSPSNFTFPAGGLRTLRAVFQDDVGNSSPVVSATITFDITAPSTTGVVFGVQTDAPTANFVNKVAVNLTFGGLTTTDATGLKLVQTTTATSCASVSFAAAALLPATSAQLFVLTGADGPKRVCAQLLDAASNPAAPLSLDLVLDTVPPTVPIVTTPSQLINLGGAFNVQTLAAVTEANFLDYQRLNPVTASWETASTTQNTTSFSFTLSASASVESTENQLRLRARDQAGNMSSETGITVTTDIKAPAPVTLHREGLQNHAGGATLYWVPSVSADVARYRVRYGPASNNFVGTYATQGPSPLFVPGTSSQLTLTGLENGTSTFATVTAIDTAGNESAPATGASEVLMQPNQLPMTTVAQINLPAPANTVHRVEVVDDVALALGVSQGPGGDRVALDVIDLSTLRSHNQTGTFILAPTSPTVIASTVFPEPTNWFTAPVMTLEGPYVFVSSETHVKVMRLFSPSLASPVVLAQVDDLTYPGRVRGLNVYGGVLFVTTDDAIYAVEVSGLYDADATTQLSQAAFATGTVSGGGFGNPLSSPAGSILTRNWLYENTAGGTSVGPYYNATNALDFAAGTGWNVSSLRNSITNVLTLQTGPQVSGNYMYALKGDEFSIYTLNALWANAGAGVTTLPRIATAPNNNFQGTALLSGSLAHLAERATKSVRSYDLGDVPSGSLPERGLFTPDPSRADAPQGLATYGNFLVMGSNNSHLRFVQLGAPRSLHAVARTTASGRHVISGGFVFGEKGSTIDLQRPGLPNLVPPFDVTCDTLDLALFGETLVQARSTGGAATLRVVNLEAATDRDAATSLAASDGYDVALGAGYRALAVKPYGNLLLVLEQRPTGVWLELLNARNARDRLPGTLLSAADSRASYQVSSFVGSRTRGDIVLQRDRAIVTIDTPYFDVAPPASVYAIDLRAWFDDDASTTTPVSQGSLNTSGAGQTAIVGTQAYVTTRAGLRVFDFSAAFDNNAATTISGLTPLSTLALSMAQHVFAYAGYVFVGTDDQGDDATEGLYVFDASNPAALRLLSFVPETVAGTQCGSTSVTRSGLTVLGPRAYLSGSFAMTVLELE